MTEDVIQNSKCEVIVVLFPSIADNRDAFKSAVSKPMNLKSQNATAYDQLRVLLSDVTHHPPSFHGGRGPAWICYMHDCAFSGACCIMERKIIRR